MQLLHAIDESRHELVIDALVHRNAARRRAALARRAESAPHRAIDREVEIRVFHHDDDVLAAHLERNA